MKWLLTTCAAPLLSPFSTREKRPPLGLGFLISVLRQAGHQVLFLDNYLKPTDFLESNYLIQNQIEAIGIYVNTTCLPDFRRMVEKLQQKRERGLWKGIIAVGGPHPSVVPESIPDFVDHITIGEGEQAILAIAENKAERIVQCSSIEDLDSLPPPAWDEFVKRPYNWTSKWISAQPIFTLNTSRGCPFHCAFCSVSSVWGRHYRFFSADWILAHVKDLSGRYGARGLYFREDNFTVNRARVERFCERLRSEGLNLPWICETRVDKLDRELIQIMHEAGCQAFYLGVESGSQRLLDFMHKGITVEQIEAVFAWCRESGVKTYASFIVGLPTETPEDREATIALSKRIRPDYATNNIFVGIPHSELYNYVIEKKLYHYLDDRGLAYLEGHDSRVEEFYGGNESFKIPLPFREHFVQSKKCQESGNRTDALREALQAVTLSPGSPKYWRLVIKSFLLWLLGKIIRTRRSPIHI